MKRLLLLGGCLLIPLMVGVACLLTLLISNDAQSLLVQSAGFEKQQGDIASFWIIRATVIVKYSPTEIAAIESNAVPLDPPAENASPAEITYPYSDFLSISSDLNGAPVAIYRASEADFLRLCDYETTCKGNGYRYERTDLRPGGGIIYGAVRFVDHWENIGLIVAITEENKLRVQGMILDGTIYTLPHDHELRPLLDETIAYLNTGIEEEVLSVNGQDLRLDAIQITDKELVIIYR